MARSPGHTRATPPVQLGFVIDQSQCIGCHACTVACKSENHVPVGNFRTWVKYTEKGSFPSVKRSFSVMRCNQCTDAPCVTICPVSALEKRGDGIVDVDPKACIGCKSCMQGCPYDALYLNEDHGTVEKCHFCAHRTEQGLAPACAVVCPTEAIIPGDFHDPESRVSQMRKEFGLEARKTEAGTGPNVLYRDVAPTNIDPLASNAAGGFIWAGRQPGIDVATHEFQAMEAKAEARTVYDVAHPALWGAKITGYLFTKSLAAGVFLAALFGGLSPFASRAAEGNSSADTVSGGLIAFFGLLFLAATSILLVADLKRPERFLYILRRPNWSSWLVRGTYALMAYGATLSIWAVTSFFGMALGDVSRTLLTGFGVISGSLAACYTGWLFGQAKGRVLWMRRGLWAHLIVQAVVAGAAFLLLLSSVTDLGVGSVESLRNVLTAWLGLHAVFVLFEGRMAPKKREREFAQAHALMTEGPFAQRHWGAGLGIGVVVPFVLLVLPVWGPATFLAALCALIGLWVEEDVLVRAGQALPIS